MTGKHASTGLVSTDEGAQHSGSASARCATGREPLAGETEAVMRNVDFSRVNLHYLICARDLARASPARAGVLLGVSDALGQSLAQLDPEALAAVAEIKAPLLILRQEPWWWKRLFAALRTGRPGEVQTVLEQAGLIIANG